MQLIYLLVGWLFVYNSVDLFFVLFKEIVKLKKDWKKEDLIDFRKQLKTTIYALLKFLFKIIIGSILLYHYFNGK